MNTNPSHLTHVLAAQQRGEALGITSICSANASVLHAAFAHARTNDLPLLVESTCNQVNQYGGYTGQTAAKFMAALCDMAAAHAFPLSRLIVGGDHLGPNPWRVESAAVAMDKARVLVRDYVRAGYTKIHLDTSMKCADDNGYEGALPVKLVAARAADLALVAEKASEGMGTRPLYVIGTEVPAPGGVDDAEEGPPAVTTPQAAEETIRATHAAFVSLELDATWERVIAVVVQPGVEYGNESLFDYDAPAAASLSRFIEGAGGLVFEAHSTDYQTREALRELVRDHFAILKVGPALTFAYREALFALEAIERAWLHGRADVTLSNLQQVVDRAMLDNPDYWRSYYPGDAPQQQLARQFSLSDRIRYYWPVPAVEQARQRLLANLSVSPIPLPLLSQYLPVQFRAVRAGRLPNEPARLIEAAVTAVLDDYSHACNPTDLQNSSG